MRIAVMKETSPQERRVPLIPATAGKLVKLGAELVLESGLGLSCRFEDADYEKVGAAVSGSRRELLQSADIILRLRKPPVEEIELMRKGCLHVSYLDPFNEAELVELLRRENISAVSLEMIPRTTLAQKMDVLSSQATIAGYRAVLNAKALGLSLLALIHISMDRHTPERFANFEEQVAALPEVLECLLITGQDADYQLKVIVRDMDAYQALLLNKITRIEGVSGVHSSFVMRRVVDTTALPLE